MSECKTCQYADQQTGKCSQEGQETGCTPDSSGLEPEDDKKGNDLSNIKHVIAVISGKGGVGKSTVTALLASAFQKRGFKTGVLDADVTGPSIPMLFGAQEEPVSAEFGILPVRSKNGISIISMNLFLPSVDEPVIWRGPIISGVIKQFWKDVIWGDLDYLFVDLPPGTGDVPLTVMQSLPLQGVVVVTSPQDLANMVVRKTVKMAEKMEIPILGIVENMSYFKCPGCEEVLYPFGKGKAAQMAEELHVPLIGILPLEASVSGLGDEGRIEESPAVNLLDINALIKMIK